MITNLREAKASLSDLVKRASEGEEVLITVRGEAKARLVGIPATGKTNRREELIAELKEAREKGAVKSPVSTSQEYWDEARADR